MSAFKKFSRQFASLLLAGLFCMGVSGQALAEEIPAELLAAARTAVNASQSTASLDAILPNLGESAKQQLIQSRPDAADKISAMVDEATLALAPRRANLEDEVARAYARIFNADELKLITDFYKTDAGLKLIKETPVIARAIEDAAKIWSAGIQRDIQLDIAKKVEAGALQ